MDNLIGLITPKKDCQFLVTTFTLRQALEKFKFHHYSVVPVLDKEGHYCGTLSEGDLLRLITKNDEFNIKDYENVQIKDMNMHRTYQKCNIDCSFDELLKLSLAQNFIPIEDGRGFFIGIIKRKELINLLYNKIK